MSCNSFWHHVSTVDRKRIQQARLVAKNAFEKAGAPINEVALDLAEEMAGDQRFRQLLDDPNQIARASVVAGFLLWAEEYVDVPDEQWANFLQKMEQELPYGLRPGLKKWLSDLVSKIERSGVSKRQAYAKAAREMNCSARTIQRAWQARGRG
jgi:hypothetical protein